MGIFMRHVGTKWSYNRISNSIQGAILLSTFFLVLVGSLPNRAEAYPQPTVINHTPYKGKVTVLYANCAHDEFTMDAGRTEKDKFVPHIAYKGGHGRGGCLITSVHVGMESGPALTFYNYKSSGTGKSEFHLFRRGDHYRVMSTAEVTSEKYDEGGSPGFLIHNKTDFPVTASLDQVGCLYHKLIKPGERWKRHTGAVWFTISAKTSLSGKDEINELKDCVYPVFQAVKFATEIALGVGGCPTCAQAAVADAGMFAATLAGTPLYDKFYDNIAPVKLPGQYAGPPSPFRCMAMPEYAITGGVKLGPVTISQSQLHALKENKCLKDASVEVLNYGSGYYSEKFVLPILAEFNKKLAADGEPLMDPLRAPRLAEAERVHRAKQLYLWGNSAPREIFMHAADYVRDQCHRGERLSMHVSSRWAMGKSQDELDSNKYPGCGPAIKLQKRLLGAVETIRKQLLANCTITQADRKAFMKREIEAGNYDTLAGGPLKIDRIGGGCK